MCGGGSHAQRVQPTHEIRHNIKCSVIAIIVPWMVQCSRTWAIYVASKGVREIANEELKSILAKLKARDARDKSKEIAGESKYSAKINKYISSLAELRFYQRLSLKEQQIVRDSLIKPDVDLLLKDDMGLSNYERMKEGRGPVARTDDDSGLELHHLMQEFDAPFAELTRRQHARPGDGVILHPKGKKKESWRSDKEKCNAFDTERVRHWRKRVKLLGR